MKSHARSVLTLAVVFAAGCAPDAAPAALRQTLISDQVHGGGTQGFFWLPPLVDAPALEGSFDGTQSPTVQIDAIDPSVTPPRVLATVARFTTGGAGSERVRAEPGARQYIVNWHTGAYGVRAGSFYRVRVLIGAAEIGVIDVAAVEGRDKKGVDRAQFVPVNAGQTLPIKFFLNNCGSVICRALDACHVAGRCQLATGTCTNPPAPDGTTCSDDNACTQTDRCQAGACVGANPVVCTALDECHVAGTCNTTTGVCSNPNAPDDTVCNDNNACTQTDRCQAGACTGGNPVVCTALDACHVAGTCNTTTGVCTNPTAPDDTVCNDGNACTQTDRCQAGACTGGNPVVCTAAACFTAGTCNPSSGACSPATPRPAGATCGDGACDGEGQCLPLDLSVVRVGDGAAARSAASTAVFLERRHLDDGTVAQTVALPTATSGAQRAFTLSGTATSEGDLTRSIDGRYVVLAGYATPPGTASVAGTTAAAVPRSVARVDVAGVTDTSTTTGSAFGGGNPRGAATVDGSGYWVAGTASGATGGAHYVVAGASTTTQILATPNNNRFLRINSGQLFGCSGSAPFTNVFTIGNGLPTTSGQTATALPGMPTVAGPSPHGFLLLDRDPAVAGRDTLYVADDRTVVNGGGVQKWVFDGGTWTQVALFTSGLGTTGARYLAGLVVSDAVMLATTSAETTGSNRIVVFIDDDSTPNPTGSTLATAPTNTAFRGVAISPGTN